MIWTAYRRIVNDPEPFVESVALDLVFAAILVSASLLFMSVLPNPSSPDFAYEVSQHRLLVLSGMLICFLGSILLYSFFKYLTLHFAQKYEDNFVRRFKKGKRIVFKRFWKFYLMNVLFIVCFILFFAIVVIVLGILFKHDYLIASKDVFILIMFLIAYALVNTMHTIYSQGRDAGESAKRSMGIIFKRPMKILPIILSLCIFALLAYGLQFALNVLIKASFAFLGVAIPFYFWTVVVIVAVIAFMVLTFHRVCFMIGLSKQRYRKSKAGRAV
ncbi:MAG: hypothetical protein ACE5DM_00780 [Candidatus Nanoarchaeia archaeon]